MLLEDEWMTNRGDQRDVVEAKVKTMNYGWTEGVRVMAKGEGDGCRGVSHGRVLNIIKER